MSLVLGIDAGNTMIKAALFDLHGRLLSVAECAGETLRPQSGHAERPPEDIWQGVSSAITRCLDKAGRPASQIIAVGAAGHGNGLYALDAAEQPVLGIQSIDTRATDIVRLLEENGDASAIYHLSLQKPWPAATPVLIRWLKQYQPERYARIAHFLCAKDVITHFLCGAIGTDYSDAAGAGLIDYRLHGYSRELLAHYGIADAAEKLPPLRNATEIVGHITPQAANLTGLVQGTPVVAGIFDVVASAVGSGVINPGEASIVAGTWSINQAVVEKPEYLRPVFMNAIIGKDRYMAIEASATSAANLDWFLREFDDGRGGQGAVRASESVAQVIPNDQLPFYHPYLYSGRKAELAKAGFYGLGGWHTRADMLYALFEGVTYAHRAHIDRLRAAGIPFTQAILSGGAARSCIWPQMFADALGIPVRVSECQETGAAGAALCAGVGAGIWRDLPEAVKKGVSINPQVFLPREDRHHFHNNRYAKFKALEIAMQEMWK